MGATAFIRQGRRRRQQPSTKLEFMQQARHVWLCAACLTEYRVRCTTCGSEPQHYQRNVCPDCGGTLVGKQQKHKPICDATPHGCGGKTFIHFPSAGEKRRYLMLRMQENAGAIEDLKLRTRFPLEVVTPAGERVTVGAYECDFDYVRDGERVVEDFKGAAIDEAQTRLFEHKRAHFEAQYGLRIAIYSER